MKKLTVISNSTAIAPITGPGPLEHLTCAALFDISTTPSILGDLSRRQCV